MASKHEEVKDAKVDVGACRRAAEAQDPRGDNNPKRRILTYEEIGRKE
jgi:hypothetical protein